MEKFLLEWLGHFLVQCLKIFLMNVEIPDGISVGITLVVFGGKTGSIMRKISGRIPGLIPIGNPGGFFCSIPSEIPG